VRRDTTIDVLRALAIIVVICSHFHYVYSLAHVIGGPVRFAIINAIFENGHYGVIAFFCISGFIITRTSLRRSGDIANTNVREFYVYRASRIVPCIALFVAVVAIGEWAGLPRFNIGDEDLSAPYVILSIVGCFHNDMIIWYGLFSYCLNILWSISIEERFYIAWPLILRGLKNRGPVVALLLALIIAGPLYRVWADDRMRQFYGFLSCTDSLAIGCLVALTGKANLDRLAIAALRVSGIAFIAVASVWKPAITVVSGDSLVALGVGQILFTAGRSKRVADEKVSAPVRLVAWCGEKSYELYLCHVLVLALFRAIAGPGTIRGEMRWVWFLLYAASAAAAAAAVSRFYSEPLKDKLRQALRPLHHPPLSVKGV
jgi:peptidoglycan/LPS O-acetylase OafA/YrhL